MALLRPENGACRCLRLAGIEIWTWALPRRRTSSLSFWQRL